MIVILFRFVLKFIRLTVGLQRLKVIINLATVFQANIS